MLQQVAFLRFPTFVATDVLFIIILFAICGPFLFLSQSHSVFVAFFTFLQMQIQKKFTWGIVSSVVSSEMTKITDWIFIVGVLFNKQTL